MPKAHTVYSYDKDIEIGQNAFGQVQVLIDGIDLVNYVPSVDDLSKPLSSSSKSQLDLNRVRLERKLGSFFKPLTEPWSELTKSQMASYWQQSPNGGLAIPFRRAIIVSKLENDLMNRLPNSSPEDGRPTEFSARFQNPGASKIAVNPIITPLSNE